MTLALGLDPWVEEEAGLVMLWIGRGDTEPCRHDVDWLGRRLGGFHVRLYESPFLWISAPDAEMLMQVCPVCPAPSPHAAGLVFQTPRCCDCAA